MIKNLKKIEKGIKYFFISLIDIYIYIYRYQRELRLQQEYLSKNPQYQLTNVPSSVQNNSSEIIFPLVNR